MHGRIHQWVAILAVSLVSAIAGAEECPEVVKVSVAKAMPNSKIIVCKSEVEHGKKQFEVKLRRADGVAVEVDVAVDGALLQIEEPIAIDQLPAAVAKAFAARYPKAKPVKAAKQTPTVGGPSFEIAFETAGKKKEATFTEAGKFVEEE